MKKKVAFICVHNSSRRGFDDDWGLPDPTGKEDGEFKKVIAEIEVKLKQLVE